MARTDRHYLVSLWDSEKYAPHTPAQAVRAAGFTWALFHLRSVTDDCLFYHVSGPADAPPWMQQCGVPDYIREEADRAADKREK